MKRVLSLSRSKKGSMDCSQMEGRVRELEDLPRMSSEESDEYELILGEIAKKRKLEPKRAVVPHNSPPKPWVSKPRVDGEAREKWAGRYIGWCRVSAFPDYEKVYAACKGCWPWYLEKVWAAEDLVPEGEDFLTENIPQLPEGEYIWLVFVQLNRSIRVAQAVEKALSFEIFIDECKFYTEAMSLLQDKCFRKQVPYEDLISVPPAPLGKKEKLRMTDKIWKDCEAGYDIYTLKFMYKGSPVVDRVYYSFHNYQIKNAEKTSAPHSVEALVLYGTSGTGKTYSVKKMLAELGVTAYWKSSDDDKWWAGYDFEDVVVWDEFVGENVNFSLFHQLCTSYAVNVQYKGGSALCHAKKIIILSNRSPSTWWSKQSEESRAATLRRCQVHRIKSSAKHSFIEGLVTDYMADYDVEEKPDVGDVLVCGDKAGDVILLSDSDSEDDDEVDVVPETPPEVCLCGDGWVDLLCCSL